MAGPYSSSFRLSNGQILRVYQAASQAVGIYCPCEINGEVASTSPTDFEVKSSCYVQDVITPNTAGIVEIIGGGVPSGIQILLDASLVASAPNRKDALPSGTSYRLVPGRRYRLLQKTAGAA